jgi:hypothetical protein
MVTLVKRSDSLEGVIARIINHFAYSPAPIVSGPLIIGIYTFQGKNE